MADTMPALNTDDSGTSFMFGLQNSRMSVATVNITIWMIGVTPMGLFVTCLGDLVDGGDLRAEVGEQTEDHDREHAGEEDEGGSCALLRVR